MEGNDMHDSEGWGVGNQAEAKAYDETLLGDQPIELIHGEFKHSYTSNTTYARTAEGSIYEFDGHHRLIDVKIRSRNYLKESYLSGDEIRKTVEGSIYSDGVKIFEFTHRDPAKALLRAYNLLEKLSEHESQWLSAKARAELIGRKIYYHNVPAVIERLVEDQGCVIIRTEPGIILPTRYDDEWDDWRRDDHYEIKDEVLSPNIWWWRSEEKA